MRDAVLLIIGMMLAMTFGFAFPKTYDEKKWERLQQKKEARIANERQYQ